MIIYLKKERYIYLSNSTVLQYFRSIPVHNNYVQFLGFINFAKIESFVGNIAYETSPYRDDKTLLWLCFEFRGRACFVPEWNEILPSKDEKTKIDNRRDEKTGRRVSSSTHPLFSVCLFLLLLFFFFLPLLPPFHCTIPCLPPISRGRCTRVCRSQNLGRAQCSSFMRGILARGWVGLRLEDRTRRPSRADLIHRWKRWNGGEGKRNFLVRYSSPPSPSDRYILPKILRLNCHSSGRSFFLFFCLAFPLLSAFFSSPGKGGTGWSMKFLRVVNWSAVNGKDFISLPFGE